MSEDLQRDKLYAAEFAEETIVAISTPPGRGGIGIVRLSGPEALRIAGALIAHKETLQHARATFTHIVHDGSTLDEALVTAFLAPHSYTGEDLVEIAAHGSPVILEHLVAQALLQGARLAQPGEFSQRAFLSGRLDLTQAEAVHDLIAAQTLAQVRSAAQQLGGALSRRIAPVKISLVHFVAVLEAGMDFASGELDDVDTLPRAEISTRIEAVRAPLAELAASYRTGAIQRNGLRLAIVGKPNAGKSSLFNRLLSTDRAIVTATAGTTRDTLEETLALDGIPVRLIDTAGLRVATEDGAENISEAEALGIARSREALADADLVLLVSDASDADASDSRNPSAPHLDPAMWDSTEVGANLDVLLRDRPVLHVRNKIDLLANTTPTTHDPRPTRICTSALTGEGLDDLRAAILAHIRSGASGMEEAALNNARQNEAVTAALTSLAAAKAANAAGLPHELLLIDLHDALRSLDTLTGETTSDDILALIFSTFCIGK